MIKVARELNIKNIPYFLCSIIPNLTLDLKIANIYSTTLLI